MYPQEDGFTTYTTFIHTGLMDPSLRSGQALRFSEAVGAFIEAKRVQRCSENTLAEYGNTFRKFAVFLGEDYALAQVTPGDIERFLGANEHLTPKTIRNYHAGLSSLWTWALSTGYVEEHVVRAVKPPRAEHKQVQPLERLEIRALLAAAARSNNPLRDKAVILFLLDTGMRASELAGLKLGDLEGSQLRVMGKGRKERRVPLSSASMMALNELLRHEGRYGGSDALFPSSQGGGHMDRHSVRKLLERLGETAGVANPNPHRFRHTFALNYLRNGGDIYTLQAILGHSTLDMVKRYLAIAQVDIQSAHEQASPVKGWNLG